MFWFCDFPYILPIGSLKGSLNDATCVEGYIHVRKHTSCLSQMMVLHIPLDHGAQSHDMLDVADGMS